MSWMRHWSTEPFKREEGGFACWIGLVSVDDFVLLICFPLFLLCGEVFFEGLFYVLFSFFCLLELGFASLLLVGRFTICELIS